MTKSVNKYMRINMCRIFVAALLTIPAISSCNKIPVGYLQTEDASFAPDTMYAYRNIRPDDIRLLEKSPWTSLVIQGVAGTVPINYEFAGVQAKEGGDAAAFEKAVNAGHVTVQGGIVRVFQEAVENIPNGVYTLSLKVYNEGHSAILKDIITVVVEEDQPIIEDESDF
ncbi:MAG: hypothetical protein PUK67_01570 [Prevotellaceae bacterium]|nr:hypothetical protein [Prevotellaceae bacterium]